MNEAEYQEQLAQDIMEFQHDPYGYANYCFLWGEGELEASPGPRKWQSIILKEIERQLKLGPVVRIAVSSGHGIGKTCLTAIIQKWALDTMPGAKAMITANTGQQLKTKDWSELAKWHRNSLTKDWFELTATAFYSSQEKFKLEWRSDQAIWRENRTEAFAGFHNFGKRILIILDEASGIPKPIWETTEGFFMDKDTEIICLVFGNPLQNSGGFWEIFHNYDVENNLGLPHVWACYKIDSREVEGVNLKEIEQMKELHGEDSDFFKTRVRGLFPNASTTQFISTELVAAARKRNPHATLSDALICGFDIALQGGDNSVFYFRRGMDGKSIPPIIIPGREIHNATVLADRACEIFRKYQPDNVFADAGGIGAPILDIIQKLGWNVIRCNFGGEAQDNTRFFRKGDEMAMAMRTWMQDGGAIWDDSRIQDDLTQREYGTTIKGQLRLESKDDMRARGLESPDVADALALTFAYPVALKDQYLGARKMPNSLDGINKILANREARR